MPNDPDQTPPLWHRLKSRVITPTRIFDVCGTTFRHPVRQVEREFIVVDAPDWVNVLALTPRGELVMVNQFRYGTNALSWEIPGGVIERGEDPVEASVRELLEETGYSGGTPRLLGSIHPNPAFIDNCCHLVLVPDAVKSRDIDWDPDEEMQVTTMPVDEVLRMGRAGEITHSLVLNALFLFEPIWREMKQSGV